MPNLKTMYRALLSTLHTKPAHRLAQTTPRLSIRPEGAPATISTQGDTTYISAQGGLNVEIPEMIESVGINNLTEVAEHRITTMLGSRSHWVRFTNGGELHFAYNGLGQLIELSARDLSVSISAGNVVNFAIPVEASHDAATQLD